MKNAVKRSTLRQTYFRSFIMLIVIPLVLVFIGAELVVGYMIRGSSIETIDALQNNIATALANDIRTNSLQLSHFVYNGDGEFPQDAVRVHNASGSDWYYADQRLQQDFNTAMVPSQRILTGGFYMKGGGAVYVKDDIVVPETEIRAASWYSDALNAPNTIVLGSFDTSRIRLTGSSHRRDQLVLATALATNLSTDRSGEIEVVTFFTESQASDILLSYNKENKREISVILNNNGQVLFGDMGNDALRGYFAQNPDKYLSGSRSDKAVLLEGTQRLYYFKSKPIPDTDWVVVTVVDESQLGQRFYPVGGLLLLIVAVLLVLFYLFSRYFLNAIISPIHTVCEGMSRLDGSDLDVYVEPTGEREIHDLMVSFNEMVQSIKNMFRMTEETTQKKHEAEIQALQRQINPHFIVNTLNSIRFMAEVAKFEGIRKMAESLVSIVSCSFRSNASFYSVADELEILRTYVYIMRIRYSNGFDVSYAVAEDCLDYLLPRLTLQPIVENSITHGFDDSSEELGEINISVYTNDDYLCLEVKDNGRGMTREQIDTLLSGKQPPSDSSGIGVENVRERLKLHFGERAGITMDSELGKFTRTVLRIPLAACKRKGDNL